MENLSRNGNIVYQAGQRSRPGRGSWLALLLLTASLLVAIEFEGRIVEQMTYRELFQDAAPLAALANTILGISIALAVVGFILAWRLWWTFSIIGTTALGMPDVVSLAAGGLRDGAERFASKGSSVIESWRSALVGAAVARSRLLGRIVSGESRFCFN